MSSSKLEFKDLNTFITTNNSTIFIVYSYSDDGKLDSYCTKTQEISDILIYIKERFLDQKSDVTSRHIGIDTYTDNSVMILQTTKRKLLTSYKRYYIYNNDEDKIQNFLELFHETKFKTKK